VLEVAMVAVISAQVIAINLPPRVKRFQNQALPMTCAIVRRLY